MDFKVQFSMTADPYAYPPSERVLAMCGIQFLNVWHRDGLPSRSCALHATAMAHECMSSRTSRGITERILALTSHAAGARACA